MASKNIKGITIEFEGKTTALNSALKEIDGQLKKTEGNLKSVDKLLKLDPTNTEMLSQKQRLLADSITTTSERLAQLKDASEKAAATAGNYDAWKAKVTPLDEQISKATQNLRKLKEEEKEAEAAFNSGKISAEDYEAVKTKVSEAAKSLETLKAERKAVDDEFGHPISPEAMDGLQREIAQTQAELKQLANEAKEFGTVFAQQMQQAGEEMQKIGSSMSRTGDQLTTKVSVPLAAAGTAVTKTAMDFESGMKQVEAISNATADEVQELTDKAMELGNAKFAPVDVANGFSYMAMAGWKTEEMMQGISGVMALAAASGSDLARTSDIVTDALTAMGYSAGDATHLADVMAAASSNANTNVELMGGTFQYAAPIVGALGYNMEDTAVAIGLMANAGIKGQKAGTALRSMLTNLSAPTDEAQNVMEEFGISLTDTEGNMLSLADVMDQLRGVMSGLNETQQTYVAKALAGKNAMTGLLAIVNASQDDYDRLTKAVNNSTGAAQAMADTMMDSAEGSLTKMKSAVEGASISLGEVMLPYVRQGADMVSGFAGKVNQMTDAEKNSLVATAALVAGFGPFLSVTGRLVSFAGSAVVAIGKFNGALSAGATVMEALGFAGATAGGLLTAAIGAYVAIGAAAKIMSDEHQATISAVWGLDAAESQHIEKVQQEIAAYDELQSRTAENAAAVSLEYSGLQALVEEYNSLIDANGNVMAGYETRASYILTELSTALGLEDEQIQTLIGDNGKLSASITDVIEKKKAEAVLSVYQEEYANALRNRQSATDELVTSENMLTDAKDKAIAADEQYQKALADYQMYFDEADKSTCSYANALSDAVAATAEAENALRQCEDSVSSLRGQVDEYNATISNYEGVSSAIVEGDTNRISDALSRLENNWHSHENSTRDSLEKQVQTHTQKYEEMRKAVEDGSSLVSEEMLQDQQKMMEDAIRELKSYDHDHSDAAKQNWIAYKESAQGIQDEAVINAEDTAKRSESASRMDMSSAASYTWGSYYSEQQRIGNQIVAEAGAIAERANNRYRATLQIHSPSRVMEENAEMTWEPLTMKGMKDRIREIERAAGLAAEASIAGVAETPTIRSPAASFGTTNNTTNNNKVSAPVTVNLAYSGSPTDTMSIRQLAQQVSREISAELKKTGVYA